MLVDRGGRGRLGRLAPGVLGTALIVASTLVLGVPTASSAAAAGSGRERLPGHQGLVPPGATLVGPAPTTTSLPLVVTLKPRDAVGLAAEVKAISDPGSPEYRHFLTPSQFAQRFGATPATIAQVTSSLEQEGLTVGTPSSTGLSLPVQSTVGQVQSAFATPISKYRLSSGKTGYDNAAAPEVPSAVAPQIQGVLGLDTLNPPQPSTSVPQANPAVAPTDAGAAPETLAPGQPSPQSANGCAASITGVEGSFDALDAPELAQAYSFGSLYSSAHYGAGSTIALVEMAGAGYSPSDIATFAQCYGIAVGPTQITGIPGPGVLGPATEESELDIETALSLAPQANIEVYEGGTSSSLYDVFSQIVSDDTAKVVSASWTNGCEAYVGQSLQNSENTLFQAAATEGQSIFVATGDQGAEGCNINGEIAATTGSNPVAQAVDPSTSTLYVANKGSNTLSVISEGSASNPANFVNAGSVHTGTGPDAVALDASDGKVFVANAGGSLTVFATATCNQATVSGCGSPSQISSGHLAAPTALAVSGNTLYVGNSDGTVALYNAATNTFITTVSLPVGSMATALTVDGTNDFVYVADSANNRVAYFDASMCNATTTSGCTSTPLTVTVGNDPVALTVSSVGGDLYVANAGGGGGISVISLSSHALVNTILTTQPPVNPTGVAQSIGLSPDGTKVLAVLNGFAFPGDVLATIDPSSQAITSTVSLETGADTMGQLVSDGSLNDVWVTDATSGKDVVQNLNLAVSDPASQPYVTAVGGTSFGHGTATLGPPPTEQVWNDALHYSDGAGGGGISKTFTMPAYQQSLGTVSGSSGTPCAATGTDCREIPDVSADADPSSGYVIYDSVNGLNWNALGGTSAAAPLWAAVVAVVASADNNTAGYGTLNPALYLLAEQSPGTYLNDVTVGNNDYNATDGGQYPALPGYDMATGLGTPVVSALATGLTVIPLPVAVSGTQTYGGSPTFSGFANFSGPGTTPTGVTLDASALTCTTVGNFTTISSTLTPGGYTLQATSCTGAVLGGPNAANYNLVYTSAPNDFTVTPIPVEVAVTGTQTYGGTPSFSGTDTPPSGVNVDTSGLTCTQAGHSTIAPTMPAGSYTVVATSCGGAILSGNATDYGVVYTSAANDFTVTTASLTVTASSPSMPYGSAPATVTPIYSGFVNADSASSLTTKPVCSTAATPTSTVLGSPYTSSCTGAVDPNYTMTYVDGSTTVIPAALAIAVSGSQANSGAPQFAGTGNVPGVTIDASGLTCALVNSSTAISGALPSGSYTLVAGSCSGAQLTGSAASNYFPSYTSSAGDFTVTGGPVPPAQPAPATPARSDGYWLVGSDGGIFTFGSAQFYGSTGSLVLQRPVVGISPTADRSGYWLVASDGGVFAFGDAGYYGSIPGSGLHPAGSGLPHSLNAPIVGMVPSSDGGGYFMVATDGGVFAFGDARFEGSCPGMGGCSGSAVSVVPDASGNGYWLITQTGSVYAFGDAPFYGAPGNQGSPVTSAVRTADGHGYWVLLSNGAVYPYGDAVGRGGPVGSVGGFNPASAIFADASGGGYWVATGQGAVYSYGDAPNDGSMAGSHLNGSIIAASGF